MKLVIDDEEKKMIAKTNIKKEHQDAYILVPKAKIQEIKEKNILINDKFKTVFTCESAKNKDGTMCVVWGYTKINTGDTVQLKGRFRDKTFIVWSLKILRKGGSK